MFNNYIRQVCGYCDTLLMGNIVHIPRIIPSSATNKLDVYDSLADIYCPKCGTHYGKFNFRIKKFGIFGVFKKFCAIVVGGDGIANASDDQEFFISKSTNNKYDNNYDDDIHKLVHGKVGNVNQHYPVFAESWLNDE